MADLRHFILDDDRRVVEATKDQWINFYGHPNRVVAKTYFECGAEVSTVFLGLNHRYRDDGPPLVFETMVFEMDADGSSDEMWRYSSWDDAVAGHDATVVRVKARLAKAGLSTVEINEPTMENTK